MTITISRGRAAVLAACAAALAVVLTVAMFLSGASQPPPSAKAADAPAVGVTVAGTGTVSGTPDALRLSMRVETTAADVSTALAQANAAADKVYKALLADGVAKADLQTSNLSIQTNYDSKGKPNGYQVGESLTAVLRDLGKAGATITKAAEAGGNATRVDGVNLDLSDTSALMTSARDRAFAEAKKKAEQYAQLAGRSLGPVQSISEVVTGNQPGPMAYDSMRSAAGSSPVPIQAGSQDVSVTVTVVFSFA